MRILRRHRKPHKTLAVNVLRFTPAVTAALLLILAACKKQPEAPPAPATAEKLVVPGRGASYTGAYIDFGDLENDVTQGAIDDFEKLVGKHQAIIASSSYWGEQTFPTENVKLIQEHGSIPLIYWSPWDKPYEEGGAVDQFNLDGIIAGKLDDYIDAWAASAKEFGHPLFVSFAKEPNGSAFPWAGTFNGAEKEIAGSKPLQYEGPETYKKAWRHVVDRVRSKGATNIIWVFQTLSFSNPREDWNKAAQYYPGADYVDWIGLSVSGQQYPDEQWSTFTTLFKQPYADACRLDPRKPVMIADLRCGEFPKSGSKPGFVTEAFDTMKKDYPRLKAVIIWNEQWQNEDDTVSDLRVDSSPESLDAYRKGLADPFWVEKPGYR